MINETPGRRVFEKGDAPTVSMFIGEASTLGKTFKRELDVGRCVAVHAEQLTHGLIRKLLIDRFLF